jgi:regulator of RNase E activity RraA
MLTAEQLEELREFDTPTVWNALEAMRLRGRANRSLVKRAAGERCDGKAEERGVVEPTSIDDNAASAPLSRCEPSHLSARPLRPNTSGFSYPGLQLRTPASKPMVGYAATAKVSGWTKPTADQKDLLFDFFTDVLATQSPSIAVVEDIDERPIGSFWGEVQATTFLALGAVGTLTQGGVRDLPEVANLGFHFFSTELMVARAESHIIAHACPVTISGMEVNPSDLIHADLHGAVVIPQEAAPDLAKVCRQVTEAELYVLAPCRQAIASNVKPQVSDLRTWRAEMAAHRAAN